MIDSVEQDYIIGAILTGYDCRRGYISHTAVSPAYQRQGVGKQLVDVALHALEAQGINKVNRVAFAYNEKGNVFWVKMGFTQQPDRSIRIELL